jgi:hypothetical protein
MEQPVLDRVNAVLPWLVYIAVFVGFSLLDHHLHLGFWTGTGILAAAAIALRFVPGMSNRPRK